MKFTIADAITTELAEKFALTQHAGYDTRYQGDYYAVDTDGDGVLDAVYHAEDARQFNPWHDNAVAVPASECFDADNDYAWSGDEGETAAEFAFFGLLETVVYDPEVEA